MTKEFSIMLAGVGGQGVILLSELLGNAAVKDGLRVRGSEALGMAARGGSVSSTIRIGKTVEAPLITPGKCDALVAMEPAEALRNIAYLSPSTQLIVNTRSVIPFTVSVGTSSYPALETIIEKLTSTSCKLIQLDAAEIARQAGNILSTNIVMLGVLFGSTGIPISLETVKEQIRKRFLANAALINIKAFDLGYQLADTFQRGD